MTNKNVTDFESRVYQCYACTKTFGSISEFRYECMCIPEKDENIMGVCKMCENVPMNEFKIQIPQDHHLSKLHDFTSEYDEHCNLVNKNAPKWSCMSVVDGNEIYYYYENTENLPPQEFSYKTVYDENYRKTHKREYSVPVFSGKLCTCCD